MTSTSPIFAPLKRISVPAVVTSMKLKNNKLTSRLALSSLSLSSNNRELVALKKVHIKGKTFLNTSWRELESVDLEIEKINVDTKIFEYSKLLKRLLEYAKLSYTEKSPLTIESIRTSFVNLSVKYSEMVTGSQMFRELTKQYENIR